MENTRIEDLVEIVQYQGKIEDWEGIKHIPEDPDE